MGNSLNDSEDVAHGGQVAPTEARKKILTLLLCAPRLKGSSKKESSNQIEFLAHAHCPASRDSEASPPRRM